MKSNLTSKFLVLAVLAALIPSAYATNNSNDQNCNGSGSCATNSTTHNNTTNQGGNGYGGNSTSSATGGSAVATGGSSNSVANGGNVSNSGNSSNTNVNANTNNVKNDVKNTNTNLNNNANVQGQKQGQAQGQSQSTKNSNNAKQSTEVTVQGDDEARNPVSTAYAPSIAPTATCALSVVGGVQVMGFGGTFGKAYIDENCATLEKVRQVALVLKDVETAEALMCQDEKYAKARATAGRECPVEQE